MLLILTSRPSQGLGGHASTIFIESNPVKVGFFHPDLVNHDLDLFLLVIFYGFDTMGWKSPWKFPPFGRICLGIQLTQIQFFDRNQKNIEKNQKPNFFDVSFVCGKNLLLNPPFLGEFSSTSPLPTSGRGPWTRGNYTRWEAKGCVYRHTDLREGLEQAGFDPWKA